jgi:hypothetical protein
VKPPVRHVHTEHHLCVDIFSERYCVALGFIVWCIHNKHIENVPAAKRIRVCASEKGKPVVRRGRKA